MADHRRRDLGDLYRPEQREDPASLPGLVLRLASMALYARHGGIRCTRAVRGRRLAALPERASQGRVGNGSIGKLLTVAEYRPYNLSRYGPFGAPVCGPWPLGGRRFSAVRGGLSG